MQLDSIKTGYASYGRNPTLWEESQGVQSSPSAPLPTPVSNASRRALDWNETADFFFVSGFTATTATAVFYGPGVLIGVGPEEIILDEATLLALQAQDEIAPATSAQGASQAARSPILEMRPAHRSLRDVPRKKMSDFERDYPW